MPEGDPRADAERQVGEQERAELARRQTELVRALVTGGPIPTGFDATRVRVAADSLLRKRAGEAAWHIPHVRASLGTRFTELFVEWSHGRERIGSAAEARAFVAYLVERGTIERDDGKARRSDRSVGRRRVARPFRWRRRWR